MRFIKYFISVILISIATAIYILCCTTEGLLFDIHYLSSLLPGTLKIDKVDGALFSGFSLQNISYHSSDENVSIQSLEVSWKPKQLLEGKFAIDTLTLEQPQITLFDTSTSSSDFSLDDYKFLRHITINNLFIHQLSVKQTNLQLTLTGELKDTWNFSWNISVPKLDTLCANCKGAFTGSGSIVGSRLIPTINAKIQGDNWIIDDQRIGKLQGDAHIIVQPKINSTINLFASQLNVNNYPIKKIAITLAGNVSYEKKALLAHVQLSLAQKPVVTMVAVLPDFSGLMNEAQKVNATINANFTDLGGLHYFVPQIKNPRGVIQGVMNITGMISKPEMSGTFNLKQGYAAIPDLGIHLDDMMIQAMIDKNNQIVLQGSIHSGTGAGQLQGNIDLNKSNYPMVFALQGKNLTALDIPKFHVMISPDIKLNLAYPDIMLEGKIVVPQAKIKLKHYVSSVTLPDETVFVGESEPKTPNFLSAAKLHLSVELGKDIFFSYKDFKTNVGGQLLIAQSPNSPATATGEIYAIKGQYSIYGQNLEIKTGRLIFTGNVLTNPGLNIEAIRKVKTTSAGGDAQMPTLESYAGTDTTVGVRIVGTAENPTVTLFSIPAGLTQIQILSSLGGEGAALMGAISAINPGASRMAGMTDKFTKMLGLSEVNIASVQTFNSTTNQMQSTPSIVVGKQVSKKLSLHYSIGIFNPVSIFNVRYQLNKHWAIQSETSSIDNGADLLYGFERS